MKIFNEAMPAATPTPVRLPRSIRMLLGQGLQGLPNPALVSYFALEADRKVYLEGEVNDEVLELQRMILRWNMEDAGIPREERKPITLYINSPGGEVNSMWVLVDAVRTSETPVNTVNIGCAASAAALIFMAGARRLMMPHSRVLIHEGSAQMTGDSVKVLDASENYRRTIKEMRDFIIDTTRIPAATLAKQKNHDWELDAATCLKYGVCDMVAERMDQIL